MWGFPSCSSSLNLLLYSFWWRKVRERTYTHSWWSNGLTRYSQRKGCQDEAGKMKANEEMCDGRRCAPQKMEYVDVSNSTDQMRSREGERKIWERIAVDHRERNEGRRREARVTNGISLSCYYCCCNISVTSRSKGMQRMEESSFIWS